MVVSSPLARFSVVCHQPHSQPYSTFPSVGVQYECHVECPPIQLVQDYDCQEKLDFSEDCVVSSDDTGDELGMFVPVDFSVLKPAIVLPKSSIDAAICLTRLTLRRIQGN